MTAPRTDTVLIERNGGIVTLRLNRPKELNAIDIEMAQSLLSAVRQISADPAVRVVVLAGAGKGFCAGGDLPTMQANPQQGAATLIGLLNESLLLLSRMDAPTVAHVQGAVAGAGLSLLLQSDFVLASDSARLNMAYIRLGTSCDVGASWFLPRIVGMRKAIEIALLSETIDARQAEQWGLVNRVVPAADLEREVQALALRLSQGPTLAYGAMKRLLRTSLNRTLADALAAEKIEFDRCAGTDDFRLGVDAFIHKKAAQFRGR